MIENNKDQLCSNANSNLTSSGNIPLCKVCGDRASGKHYGVSSCDGCRGFFKRSIRRNLEYVCKEGGKCIVDVARRNQCQACRFAKCIQSNMRREAVQHERAPRSCQGYQQDVIGIPIDMYSQRRLPIHHPSGLILPIPVHLPSTNLTFSSLDQPSPRYSIPTIHSRCFDPIYYGNSMFSPVTQKYIDLATLYDTNSSNTINYINASTTGPTLNLIEPPKKPKFSIKDDEVTSSEEIRPNENQHTATITSKSKEIIESATKLLLLIVKWARSMPSFMQIPMKDQNLLLRETWPELFIVTAIQYEFELEDVISIINAKNQLFQKVIRQLIAQRLDHSESACLKALILFRPECPGLESQHQVSMLQEHSLNILFEKCGGIRMGHLLLTLPIVRSATDRIILQELLFKNKFGEVGIDQILSEFI